MAFNTINFRDTHILSTRGEIHIGELFGTSGDPAGYSVYFLDPSTTKEIESIEFDGLAEAIRFANDLEQTGCKSGGGCATGGSCGKDDSGCAMGCGGGCTACGTA